MAAAEWTSGAEIETFVKETVAAVQVVDLHTHLFPPSHEKLFSAGVNDLLTYHYLVAELFMVVPGAQLRPEAFHKLTRREQADVIWEELFIKRSPISEACRGVVTTLSRMGLRKEVASRDLASIRAWYGAQTADGLVEKVFSTAGVRYAVMTNIPFVTEEAECWQPTRPVPACLKTALRIDPLFNPDVTKRTLESHGLAFTTEGALEYLRRWVQILQPLYLMASFPYSFRFPPTEAGATGEWSTASVLDNIVMPLAVEFNLPLAMKCGTQRQVNPSLKDAGDGVGVADMNSLQALLVKYPKVKFLATFLSRENQHALCVLARKFSNLHVYGCWWFLNNPSLIEELTRMRVEMMGTAFTCQHSDARVLDQLVYKWAHSRDVVGRVLATKYRELLEAGWAPSRDEIRRDIGRWFGDSFEEFMAKELENPNRGAEKRMDNR